MDASQARTRRASGVRPVRSRCVRPASACCQASLAASVWPRRWSAAASPTVARAESVRCVRADRNDASASAGRLEASSACPRAASATDAYQVRRAVADRIDRLRARTRRALRHSVRRGPRARRAANEIQSLGSDCLTVPGGPVPGHQRARPVRRPRSRRGPRAAWRSRGARRQTADTARASVRARGVDQPPTSRGPAGTDAASCGVRVQPRGVRPPSPRRTPCRSRAGTKACCAPRPAAARAESPAVRVRCRTAAPCSSGQP